MDLGNGVGGRDWEYSRRMAHAFVLVQYVVKHTSPLTGARLPLPVTNVAAFPSANVKGS